MEAETLSPLALSQLLDARQQFLSFVRRRVESEDVAEDILQSAFVKAVERGSELQDDESVVAWFYRVLRNAVIDHYRSRAAHQRKLDEAAKEIEPFEKPHGEWKGEVCACFKDLLKTMKPEYQEALQIVDLEEKPLRALADKAGISANNAGVRVHRAREALRREVMQACSVCAEHGCFDCTCKTKA